MKKRAKRTNIDMRNVYRRDRHQPRYTITLEWNGGLNVPLEKEIKRLANRHHGRFEGSGCEMFPPFRRDMSIEFLSQLSFNAFSSALRASSATKVLNEAVTIEIVVAGAMAKKAAISRIIQEAKQ